MPELNQEGNEAFNLWEILSDDRATGFGPSTIRTEAIIFLCLALGETWEMFLLIKTIERVYFQKMIEDYSKSSKGQNTGEIGSDKPKARPKNRRR